MAEFQITAPDGQVLRLTPPDGATQDQINAGIQEIMRAYKPQYGPPKPERSTMDQALRAGGMPLAGFNEGMAHAVGAIPDAAMWLARQAGASPKYMPGGVGDWLAQQTRGPADLPSAQIKPENALERFGHGAGEMAGTTAAMMTGGALLAGTAKAGGVAQKIGQFMASNPRMQLTSSALGGGTAEATDSAWLGLLAGLSPVVPGLLKSGYQAASNAISPLNRVVKSVTPQAEIAAQQFLDRSRQLRAPLTIPEALEGTGTPTNLTNVMRVLEQSTRGNPVTAQFFAERAGQNKMLARGLLGHPGVTMPPTEIPPKVQAAASDIVGAFDKARTAVVNPLYQAANSDRVPAAAVEGILSRIDRMIASDKTGILHPELKALQGRLIETPATAKSARVPITDIENLDRARKFTRDGLSLPLWAEKAVDKETGAKVASLLDDLRSEMTSNSPAFDAGKQLYARVSEKYIDPLKRSPIGQLAQTADNVAQDKILFAIAPREHSEAGIRQAVQAIAAKDPDAAKAMVKSFVTKTFHEMAQENIPGPNQWGGAKFRVATTGNEQQARNMEAAVRAAFGDKAWETFKETNAIFGAQGTRQRVGAQTAFNVEIQDLLKGGGLVAEAGMHAASPGSWLTAAKDIGQRLLYGRNTENLARIMTGGDIAALRGFAAPGTQAGPRAALAAQLLAQQSAPNLPALAGPRRTP